MSYTSSLYDSDRRIREMEIERDRRRYASAYSAASGINPFTVSVVSETTDLIELEIIDSITGSRVRLYHTLSKRHNSLLAPSIDLSSKTSNITLLLLL